MLIKGDAKQLEWRTYIELSEDPVGLAELKTKGLDIHSNNQARFNLPTRLIAKTFLFRWIYRGSAYAYSIDPDFKETSSDQGFWQDVINKANEKYHVLYEYQNRIIDKVKQGNLLTIPSGRQYRIGLSFNSKGEAYWDEKSIVNYINQGFAADLMKLVRISIFRSLRPIKGDVLLINSVHDDLELDVDNNPELLYNICILVENVFEDIPKAARKHYGIELKVPYAGEVSFGPNMGNLKLFDKNKGKEQFYED